MELDELKNSWNALNERLAESKVVNQRMVKEIIAQKTKSAFERIYRIELYNLFYGGKGGKCGGMILPP